ncbi:hypothetical protein F4802DRAFT_588741 [Xylaria palmicola]|nr:hypothetical protein F4802DRAFT_588741 [Xylaria palmicola]
MSTASSLAYHGEHPLAIRTRPTRHALNNVATNVRKDKGSLLKSVAHGKILKRSSSKPQPGKIVHWRDVEIAVIPLLVPRKHFQRAVSLYRKLRTLPLECPIPSFQSRDASATEPGMIGLGYPRRHYWRLIYRLHDHQNRGHPILTRHEVQTLRCILIRDIALLYDAHVPYEFDMGEMAIARISSRRLQCNVYKPFINRFNLDVDPEDESIDWAVLKEKTIRSAEARFAVIEALVEFSSEQPEELPADLEPDAVLDVLDTADPGLGPTLFILRHVSRYNTELVYWLALHARFFLSTLPSRDNPANSPEEFLLDYYNTVGYMLKLVDVDQLSVTDQDQRHQLLADRVVLLVLYTSFLIHLHAKTIVPNHSRNILVLENQETPDMYAGLEQFQLVTEARRRLKEAMDVYDAMGNDGADWFLRQPLEEF